MPANVAGRLVAAMAVLFVTAGLLASCGGGVARPEKAEGSALWVAAGDVGRLDAETRAMLRGGGIRELFVEAGTLAAEGGTLAVAAGLGDAAGVRMPVTLVVGGEWPAAADPEAAAAALAPALRTLRRRAEERGLTPVGYHLDVVPPRGEDALERYAAALEATREAVDADLLLSASLDPQTLAAEGAEAVAGAVDFVVPFLYGQRPDAGPAPAGDAAWDLGAAEPALARLAELGRPYLLGIGTAGVLRRLGRDGETVEETREARLRDVVGRPALAPGRAALLDALDRQSYAFEAERAVVLGRWRLGRGEQVQVLRLSAHHLRRAAARAEEVSPELHLGQVYVRLAAAGEDLSLSPGELAAAGGEGPLVPELAVTVEPAGGRGRFRVRLANRGPVATDVAYYETNYVELRALGGGTIASVDGGGFQRYQIEHEGRRVADTRALRAADRVKLFAPLVEPGDEVVSGPVEIRGAPRGGPVVVATARFAVPGGELAEPPAVTWPGSEAESGGR